MAALLTPGERPITVAIADPPYPGMAHLYRDHPDYRGEVDHAALVAQLERDYPDGWALCTSSVALRDVLTLCPADVRVLAWVKPFASFKPGVGVAYAWEPVLVKGGRRRTRGQQTVRDWVAANVTLRRGLAGVKPDAFCFWVFAVLNLRPGDTLADLFPGSGAISRAFTRWCSQMPLFSDAANAAEDGPAAASPAAAPVGVPAAASPAAAAAPSFSPALVLSEAAR